MEGAELEWDKEQSSRSVKACEGSADTISVWPQFPCCSL